MRACLAVLELGHLGTCARRPGAVIGAAVAATGRPAVAPLRAQLPFAGAGDRIGLRRLCRTAGRVGAGAAGATPATVITRTAATAVVAAALLAGATHVRTGFAWKRSLGRAIGARRGGLGRRRRVVLDAGACGLGLRRLRWLRLRGRQLQTRQLFEALVRPRAPERGGDADEHRRRDERDRAPECCALGFQRGSDPCGASGRAVNCELSTSSPRSRDGSSPR